MGRLWVEAVLLLLVVEGRSAGCHHRQPCWLFHEMQLILATLVACFVPPVVFNGCGEVADPRAWFLLHLSRVINHDERTRDA